MERLRRLYIFALLTFAVGSIYQNCGNFATNDLSSTLEGGPLPTLSSSVSGPTTQTPIPMKLNFDTQVVGMNLGLIKVTNGAASNFKEVQAGQSFTFDLTPTSFGDVLVFLPATAVKDPVGKSSMPSNNFDIIFGSTNGNRFKVDIVDNRKFPFYFNKVGTAANGTPIPFGTPCAIDIQSTETDVRCLLDVNEGDLVYNGFTLSYQIPPGMCRYLARDNYAYYNFETGIGPQTVTVYVNKNGAPHPGCGATNASFCFTVDSNPTIYTATSLQNLPANLEISAIDPSSLQPTCRYDHSVGVGGGPNCCLGSYTLATNVIPLKNSPTDPTPANINSISTIKAWGGKLGACLAGPGADDSKWPKTTDGFPATVVDYTANGIGDLYTVTAPNLLYDVYSLPAANFFTPGDAAAGTGPHFHTGNAFTAIRSAFPTAIDPIDDRATSTGDQRFYPAGERLPATSAYYSFSCLDEGFEVLHRIRVQVREWNTYAEFLKYGTPPAGVNGNPAVTGIEGINCNIEFNSGSNCNDFLDWDDIVIPVKPTDRALFFPSAPHK